jgi:hypothetical protein
MRALANVSRARGIGALVIGSRARGIGALVIGSRARVIGALVIGSRARVIGALVIGSLMLAAGCGNHRDSLVLVTLTSPSPMSGIARVHTHATVAGRSADFDLAPPSGVAATPLTFGIDIPSAYSGNITLAVDVYDTTDKHIGSGGGSGSVTLGGERAISVALKSLVAAGADMAQPDDLATADLARTPPPSLMDMALPPPPDLSLPAVLGIDTNLQAFGSVTQGKTSASAQFTISNAGTVMSGLLMLAKTGDTGDFTITTDCSGNLAPMAECHIDAAFAPQLTSTGAKEVDFTLDGIPGGSVMGKVTGTALTPGKLGITPDVGDCGSALLGTTSTTTASFTVKNSGNTDTAALTVASNDAQFTTSGCAGTLGGGASCTVTVGFKPTKRQTSVASITVSEGTSGDVATASVKGVGQVAANLQISPASYPFPGGPHGTAAQSQDFTVTNQGDLPSTKLAASKITGANAAAFAITSDGCSGKTLAGGANCVVTVRFTPQFTGAHAATLEIHDATTPPLLTASLTGTGQVTWIREYSGTAPNNYQGLTSVFAAGTHAYAVGNAGAFASRNSDGTWTEAAIDANDYFLITGSTAADLWIASTNRLVKTSGNFEYQTAGPPSGSSVSGVISFSPEDAWILFSTTANPSVESLYHFNGASMTQTSASVTRGTSALWGLSSATMYAIDEEATCVSGPGLVEACSYALGIVYGNGTSGFTNGFAIGTYTSFPIPPLGPIWGSSTSDIYCSGAPILHSTGDGKFTAIDPSSGSGALGIWGSSATDVWFAEGANNVYRGNGTTWQQLGVGTAKHFYAGNVYGTGPNDVYAVGYDDDGYAINHWF